MKRYYVYIMSNLSGTLYTGVTKDLFIRVYQHKNKQSEGFTKKYNISRLIYFEEFQYIQAAIVREKQIKSWRRKKKLELIRSKNSKFSDLAETWYEENKSKI